MQAEFERYCALDNPNIVPTFGVFPSSLDYKYDEMVLGLRIRPLGNGAEQQLPVVQFGPKGIVRCEHCKAYMNPMNIFSSDGLQYTCSLCESINQTPSHYSAGSQRQHLTIDIVPAEHEFRSEFPSADAYLVLVVENSQNIKLHGLDSMMVAAVNAGLDAVDPQQNVLLVSYDTLGASLYDLSGEEPVRYVLNDLIDKPFKLKESRLSTCKEQLLEVLNNLDDIRSAVPTFTGSSLSLAVKAADFVTQLLMGIGGRVLHIFTTNKPYQPANSDPSNIRSVLHPQFSSCGQLANRCNRNSIAYTMFLITNEPSTVPTLSDLPRLTEQSFYLYRRSQQEAYRFYYDLLHEIGKSSYYSCTNRLRMSCTISTKDGTPEANPVMRNWYLHNQAPGLTTFPVIQPSTEFSMELELQKNLQQKYLVLQNSLLYTTVEGQKRLRVSNLVLRLSSELVKDIRPRFNRSVLIPTVIRRFLLQLAKHRNIELVRQEIMRYSRLINSQYNSVQWAPEVLLATLAMLRSNLLPKSLKLTDSRHIDQLWVSIIECLQMKDWQLQQQFLPYLYRVQATGIPGQFPDPLSLHLDSLADEGIYILDRPNKILAFFASSGVEYTLEQAYDLLEGEQCTSNPAGWLLSELRSQKPSGYAPLSYIMFRNDSDDYLELLSTLIYTRGRSGFDESYEQFRAMLS